MSKEKTQLEELYDLIMTDPTATLNAGRLCEYVIKPYINKEKEQREELIKKAFTDGANWELYGDDKTQEERAEQYYNEVIKSKQNG